jgi:hypothetical protein
VVGAAAACLVFSLFLFGDFQQEPWMEVGSLMDLEESFFPALPTMNPRPLDSWVDGGHQGISLVPWNSLEMGH